MLVINNTTEIRMLAYQVKKGEGEKPPLIEMVKLVPGCNDVSADAWAQLEKNEYVRALLTLETPTGKPMIEVDKAVDLGNLAKIEPKKAVKIVMNTFDRELLRSWQRVETRRDVGNAVDGQLGMVSPTARPAEVEEEA